MDATINQELSHPDQPQHGRPEPKDAAILVPSCTAPKCRESTWLPAEGDEAMSERQQIDVVQLMERIRESIRRRRVGENNQASESHTVAFEDGQAAADLAYLHSGYDIQNVSFASRRRVLGPFVVTMKRVLRKLLTPILERQVAYNAATARVTARLKESLQALDRQQVEAGQALKTRMETIEVSEASIRNDHAQLQERVSCLESQLQQELAAVESRLRGALAVRPWNAMHSQLRLAPDLQERPGTPTGERISRAERKLRLILDALGAGQPEDERLEPTRIIDRTEFDEREGREENVEERRRIYVQYFEGRKNVIDLSCGRGEFLELLRGKGITARGIDRDLDMIRCCREKGLDAAQEDTFVYMAAQPDDSVGGIFATQVIGQLRPPRVLELVKLCYLKLAPGGVLVLKTPSPECLMGLADRVNEGRRLSGVQPVFPDTIQFLFEATGFHEVELGGPTPFEPFVRIPLLQASGAEVERFNHDIERLNSLLFGVQEYAMIGRKPMQSSPPRSSESAMSGHHDTRGGHQRAGPCPPERQ